MSKEYDIYLADHKSNVAKGFKWLEKNLPELIFECSNLDADEDLEQQICFAHDESKTRLDEYEAYDDYFYGGNRSYGVVQAFNEAWLFHIHRNPHHWQHWVLIHDDVNKPEECIEMPTNYVLEMICDWWAFSWSKENLYEIFKWYEDHQKHIKFHSGTRILVERILNKIKNRLDELRKESV